MVREIAEMKTSTYGVIERVFFELAVLQQKHVSIMELAERTEVNQRTVERDFQFIRERLGIKLVMHRYGRNVTWSCDEAYRIPKPVGM